MAPPETLWEIQLPDGSRARCVLAPARPKHVLVWYVDDDIQGVAEFEDLCEARQRGLALREHLVSERR